jgi:hypothetical protein
MTSQRAVRQRAERFHRPAAGRDVEQVPGEPTIALPIIGGRSRRWRRGWRRCAWDAIPIANAATYTPAAVSSEAGSCSRSIDRVELRNTIAVRANPLDSKLGEAVSVCLRSARAHLSEVGFRQRSSRRMDPQWRRGLAVDHRPAPFEERQGDAGKRDDAVD